MHFLFFHRKVHQHGRAAIVHILRRLFSYCEGVKGKCLGPGRWQKAGGKEADGKWEKTEEVHK